MFALVYACTRYLASVRKGRRGGAAFGGGAAHHSVRAARRVLTKFTAFTAAAFMVEKRGGYQRHRPASEAAGAAGKMPASKRMPMSQSRLKFPRKPRNPTKRQVSESTPAEETNGKTAAPDAPGAGSDSAPANLVRQRRMHLGHRRLDPGLLAPDEEGRTLVSSI